MPPTTSSRLTSTAALILERTRVVSLGLTPSPATDTKIARALRQVRDDLAAQRKEASEDEWKRWEDLVEMMREDDVGRTQVKGLERPVEVVPPETRYKDDNDTEDVEEGYRNREPLHADEPYRDVEPSPTSPEPLLPLTSSHQDRRARSFDADLEAGDEQDLMLQHRNIIDDQDARLALLSTSITRQNDLSLAIGHELDLHQEILEETDAAMGYTQRGLDRAAGRLRRVADGTRNHCAFCFPSSSRMGGEPFVFEVLAPSGHGIPSCDMRALGLSGTVRKVSVGL
ncbi:hypothetical protein NliqN6_0991 [Naganishia liquefaciens]|uniref:t-SNARE coiled-coil homology domain-containing protein n=1 Tax=Naganishia liquefaciens TaxID=104408 RepID=A0A8H3TQS4_9TREE|nr:hypothetical protein NliqN6_0991 [Naganishia liquefaciens]